MLRGGGWFWQHGHGACLPRGGRGETGRLDGERLGVEVGLDGGGLQELGGRGGTNGGCGTRGGARPLSRGRGCLLLNDKLLRLLLDQRVGLDVGIGYTETGRDRQAMRESDRAHFTLTRKQDTK